MSLDGILLDHHESCQQQYHAPTYIGSGQIQPLKDPQPTMGHHEVYDQHDDEGITSSEIRGEHWPWQPGG